MYIHLTHNTLYLYPTPLSVTLPHPYPSPLPFTFTLPYPYPSPLPFTLTLHPILPLSYPLPSTLTLHPHIVRCIGTCNRSWQPIHHPYPSLYLTHILSLTPTLYPYLLGALARAIDRGSRSINFALSAMLFHVAPTAFEVSLVSGILAYQLGTLHSRTCMPTRRTLSSFRTTPNNTH